MDNYNYSHLKVLIADDSDLMRDLLRGLLEMAGVRRFMTATDAEMALDQLKRFDPDLVVTDWNMPPTSGLEFVRRVRHSTDLPNPYVPIIMVTGYTEEYRVREARDAGVSEFLAKPVTAAAFFDRLRAVVEDQRNFVRSARFAGPDRRRGRRGQYMGTDRRARVPAKT
jgi:two-component system, chemotaxis family, chemotaxis protein CheY